MIPLLVIAGPTASGKSALALELACELGGEIVNADSQQVYRGLDIGTGKPTPDERARVPHHLYDVADAWEQLDAARFVALADSAIADVRARDRVPIVVGGTGLWIRALLHGLVDAPPRDETLRKQLETEADANGLASLHARLREVDPESAAKIHATDPVRIIRALEVFALTGTPLSELHRRHAHAEARHDAVRFALDVPMPELEKRIRTRVRGMFEQGLVAETLQAKADPRALERLQRVMGYREALALIDGTMSRDEAENAVVLAQRQYAKRQRTWFRAESQWTWVSPEQAFSEVSRNFREALARARTPGR